MLIRISPCFAAVCLLTFSAGTCLYGQATGSISGTISDPSGAAVPGAKVTVTAPATGASRSSTTNESGEYTVPLLGVSDYTVQVELAGFQTAKTEGIRLQT